MHNRNNRVNTNFIILEITLKIPEPISNLSIWLLEYCKNKFCSIEEQEYSVVIFQRESGGG